MLVAKYNNQLIYAKDAANDKKYFCDDCHEQLILKKGLVKVPYFAHRINSKCVINEPETTMHLRGKNKIYFDLKQCYKNVELEKYLKIIKQRPDVLLNNFAIEYQCSPISDKRLLERVSGYKRMGINSFWILGNKYAKKSINSQSVLRFLRFKKTIGYYLVFFNASQNLFIIRHHINVYGFKIKYMQETFNDILQLFRFMRQQIKNILTCDSLFKITYDIENKRMKNQLNEIQNFCYIHRHNITGCPIISHFPLISPPFMVKHQLYWKIKLIIQISEEKSILFDKLYQNYLMNCNDINHYIFIKDIKLILKNIFNNYLNLLQANKYILFKNNKVELINNFKWYKDSYAKIEAIKILKKEE